MTIENMLKLAKKNLKTALLFGMFLGALSFLILVMTQKNFRSNMDILVSQSQPGADYYTLSQSADYLTNILSQSIYSEKFLDEVNASGKISGSFLAGNNAQKIKRWQKIVRVKNNSNVGIMNIEVFGDTQTQAEQISQAVLDVLVNQNSFFLGQDQNVNVRVLSGPIVEKNPSFFQIILSAGGGFAVGIVLVWLGALYREEYGKRKINEGEIVFTNENIQEPENNEIPIQKNQEINGENHLSANSEYWRKRLEDSRG